MAKHNAEIAKTFEANMQGCTEMDEHTFQDKMNQTVIQVETNDEYDSKQKLKIYSLMTYLSNCGLSERKKYVKKVLKTL